MSMSGIANDNYEKERAEAEYALKSAVAPPSQVAQQQQEADKTVSVTGDLVDELERRLEAILTVSDEQPTPANRDPELMLVPLADWQRNNTRCLTRNNDRLRRIIDRIQL